MMIIGRIYPLTQHCSDSGTGLTELSLSPKLSFVRQNIGCDEKSCLVERSIINRVKTFVNPNRRDNSVNDQSTVRWKVLKLLRIDEVPERVREIDRDTNMDNITK